MPASSRSVFRVHFQELQTAQSGWVGPWLSSSSSPTPLLLTRVRLVCVCVCLISSLAGLRPHFYIAWEISQNEGATRTKLNRSPILPTLTQARTG